MYQAESYLLHHLLRPRMDCPTAEAGGDVDVDMTSLAAESLVVSAVTLGVQMPATVCSNASLSENSTSLVSVGGLVTPGSLVNPP
jgi:hypothetical protein